MNRRAVTSIYRLGLLLLFGCGMSLLAQQDTATIQGPSQVDAGSTFSVTFSGPKQKGDYVTIVAKGARDNAYLSYAYTTSASPATLTAPDHPGDYELRYITGQSKAVLASQPIAVGEVTATVQGPAQVNAGSTFEVTFSGPNNAKDYITIVVKGAGKNAYLSFAYATGGSPATLTAPDNPGDYELRYVTGQSKVIIASQPITVGGVTAMVQGPAQVNAGDPFEVTFSGPNNAKDYITIVAKGANKNAYLSFAYATSGSPATLTAPDNPGDYELRYVTGQSKVIIASQPITVGGVTATIQGPAQVKAGSSFEVIFSGPMNDKDFVTIVAKDAAKRAYLSYQYSQNGSPTTLEAPETPGPYELRYVTGQSKVILATQPITVGPVTASVTGPPQVKRGETFEVSWEGPNNNNDYITIVKAGSADDKYGEYTYTKYGNPSLVLADGEPGAYELRYMTRGGKTLARAPITLVGAPVPGSLMVLAGTGSNTSSTSTGSKPANVEIILDASGSMLKKLDGKRRIDIAKAALTKLLETMPAETPLALRVFGHIEAKSCRTDLAIPLAPLNRDQALQTIAGLTAKNLARTPIGASLAKVNSDLSGVEGEAIVILLTDGEETCGGDPEQEIKSLREMGYDLRVNIVGFAIEDKALKRVFQKWARIGGGTYFDARNANDLAKSFDQALEAGFQIMNDAGKVVASGVVGGKKIALPAGTYQLQVGNDAATKQQVQVRSGETSKVHLK